MNITKRIADQHISRSGTKEYENRFPSTKKQVEVFKCDYCNEEFTNEEGTVKHNLYRQVIDHLEIDHPDELARDPYPNEDVFTEWAETIGNSVEEPRVPGDPLVIHYSETQKVKLHESGAISLEAYRIIGGDREDETVRIEGKDRLAVRGRSYRNGYISMNAFPI